jgi:hypothetical protein
MNPKIDQLALRERPCTPDLATALRALVKAVETYTNATPEDWPELTFAHAALAAAEAPLRERLCTPMTIGEASAAASTVL